MTTEMKDRTDLRNPTVPDWQNIELSETWPDTLNLGSWKGISTLLRSVFGKTKTVRLPDSFNKQYTIPKYVLQEFHNLPNGNYSQRFSRGYITGFDFSMLGLVSGARNWIADKLEDCKAVADVGTAGGKTAGTIKARGVDKVWGIDPSPYLLKHASVDFPNVDFLQGVAENLPFEKERLDGISACFVFHEIPPKHIQKALEGFYQALKPGGLVAICEPSERQLDPILLKELLTTKGWLKVYFKKLAHFVYEPFLGAWHKQDKDTLFKEAGFEIIEQKLGMPMNLYLIQKPII